MVGLLAKHSRVELDVDSPAAMNRSETPANAARTAKLFNTGGELTSAEGTPPSTSGRPADRMFSKKQREVVMCNPCAYQSVCHE